MNEDTEGDAMTTDASPLLSVVIPAHNEEAGIEHALGVIRAILDKCDILWEIIVVDDGSRDATFATLSDLATRDARIHAIRFSRNFGKEAALLAGLRAARGQAVVTIDADLQHPPSLIPDLLESWRRGAKVVHAVKRERHPDGASVRARAWMFNQVLSRLGGIDIRNSSDYKLLDRVAVDVIVNQLHEHRRFYRGLADWVGYDSAEVAFDVAEREHGSGKWSVFGLLDLAVTALVSFTSAPLRIVTIMGFMTLTLGFGLGIETLWSLWRGATVSGFATIILTVLIIGSFIMISLGIIGEYIAKIYDEVKNRPIYLIDRRVGFGPPQSSLRDQPDRQ
jgi:glycosyltransferase involved in cell wall biosynthesis